MSYQFQNISVLVVEESREMLSLIRSVLTTFGVGRVHGALSAEEGFHVFCKEDPDILLVDWLSEPTTGLALTKRIRTDALSPNPYVPIILMTGFSQKKRVTLARDSGITEFLVKPFTSQTLFRRIQQIVERPRQFVRVNSFFGPDRRRRSDEEEKPPVERRAEQRKKQRQRKAHEVAQKIFLNNEKDTTP